MEDIKEKTADELFSELGYEKIDKGNWVVGYFYEKDLIFFIMEKKLVGIHKEGSTSPALPMEELQAINKKCKELNWLGDE